jgi:hypothetical protein
VQVIDAINQCASTGRIGTTQTVNVGGVTEVRFVNQGGPAGQLPNCEGQTQQGGESLRAGPALVGYIDGATSARVIAKGGGKSAIAIGAMLEPDYSEAIPNSYGVAAHFLSTSWTGRYRFFNFGELGDTLGECPKARHARRT